MRTTWILVADSSRAKILERRESSQRLEEIADFINTPGRSEDHELSTDERGRFYGKGEQQGHTAEPAVSPVEHENMMFALNLTQFLDKARNDHRYDRLCLIAPPKFLGLIRNKLNKEVQHMVEEELPKDISMYTPPQLEAYINEKLNIRR